MIAAVLRAAPLMPLARRALAESFADALAREHPRFDRDRFLVACENDPGNDRH